VNAVHHMLRVLDWLRDLNTEWADRPDKQHPLCSVGEVHVTTIAGGDFYANVPESCRATLDICYVPGEEDADGYGGKVKAEIEEHLARLESGWLAEQRPRLRWLVDFPPAEISADEPLVRELAGSVAASLGRRPRILGLDTWDDTVSLIREANMPSVSFGPGSNDQAHAVDEFVSVAQLEGCARAMEAFARSWCGQPQTADVPSRADEGAT
jgi:acetylornithine deacetylase